MNLSKLLMTWALKGYHIDTQTLSEVGEDTEIKMAKVYVYPGPNAEPTATIIYITNYRPRMIRADVFLGCRHAIIKDANISELEEWVK